MRAAFYIVPGCFFGGMIEPGTFHREGPAGPIPPATTALEVTDLPVESEANQA